MKKNELRIGDLINRAKAKDYPLEDQFWETVSVTEKTFSELDSLFWEHEPIPLTSDWLVKFGFEKYNDCFYKIKVKGKYVDGWYFSNLGELTKSLGEFMVRISYVHQLQNLYYALTNEDLPV